MGTLSPSAWPSYHVCPATPGNAQSGWAPGAGAGSGSFSNLHFSECRSRASQQLGRLNPMAQLLEARVRSVPTNLVDRIEDGHIQPQGRERAKQQGILPGVEQR